MKLILSWATIIFFSMAAYRKAQLSGYLQGTIQFIGMTLLDTALLVFIALPVFLIFAGVFERVMKKGPVWEVWSFPLITLVFFPAAPWVELFSDPFFLITGGLFILTFKMFFPHVTKTFVNMGPFSQYYKQKMFGYYMPINVNDFIKPRIHFFAYALMPILLKVLWIVKSFADQ